MAAFPMLVGYCTDHPKYSVVEQAYQTYFQDRAPCKSGVVNQCAVRMSVALGRAGFDLIGFPNAGRVHRNRPSCQLDVPHVLGARELADYLRRVWGGPANWSARAVAGAPQELAGRRGVVYFDNCFTRAGDTRRSGDHIDLWTGQQYYNQLLQVGAGGDAGTLTPLFGRSEAVWFWPLW